jgi:hypothetical protein
MSTEIKQRMSRDFVFMSHGDVSGGDHELGDFADSSSVPRCHSKSDSVPRWHALGGQTLDRKLAMSFSYNEAEKQLTSRRNGSSIDGECQGEDKESNE